MEALKIFKEYPYESSILDDFQFYEKKTTVSGGGNVQGQGGQGNYYNQNQSPNNLNSKGTGFNPNMMGGMGGQSSQIPQNLPQNFPRNEDWKMNLNMQKNQGTGNNNSGFGGNFNQNYKGNNQQQNFMKKEYPEQTNYINN